MNPFIERLSESVCRYPRVNHINTANQQWKQMKEFLSVATD